MEADKAAAENELANVQEQLKEQQDTMDKQADFLAQQTGFDVNDPEQLQTMAAEEGILDGVGPPMPQYDVEEGDKQLIVKIKLETLGSVADVDLDISEKYVECFAPGYQKLVVPLPQIVNGDGAQAKFSKKNKTLKVTCPIK